jgi:hypothetical protein
MEDFKNWKINDRENFYAKEVLEKVFKENAKNMKRLFK